MKSYLWTRRKAVALLVGILLLPHSSSAQEIAAKRIQAVIAKYAQSIDNADTQLVAAIWSKGEGVTLIHPRGEERGVDEILRNFYGKTMSETFSEREFNAKLRNDGSPLKTLGRETQIYRNEGVAGWRIVHVHYSGMPVTGEQRGF